MEGGVEGRVGWGGAGGWGGVREWVLGPTARGGGEGWRRVGGGLPQ